MLIQYHVYILHASKLHHFITMTMIFVIDMQGFRGCNNTFIIKELAVVNVNENFHRHFILKPPFSFSTLSRELQCQAHWVYENHHGLKWEGGLTTFWEVKEYLLLNMKNTTIYVKGTEKKKWLDDLLGNIALVFNVEDHSCPNLKSLKQNYPDMLRCNAHSGCCALQNAFLLKKFITQNNNQM